MKTTFTLSTIIFLLMQTHTPIQLAQATSSYPPESQPHPLQSIGIRLQPFATISSGKELEKEKSLRIQLFWNLLNPSAVQSIRQDCGKRVFIRMLKSITNSHPSTTPNGNRYASNNDLLKSANCTFTQEYATISLYHDPSSEFVMTQGRMVSLSIESFVGSDSEEVCSIKLRGYEKFSTIFVAYNFKSGGEDGDGKLSPLNILKFPQSFAKLVNVNAVKKEGHSSPSAVIFDPDLGKGKTFQKTKKCIEVLLSGLHTPFVMDVVEYFCIIECRDVDVQRVHKKHVKKKEKKKESILKSNNNKTDTMIFKTSQRVEL